MSDALDSFYFDSEGIMQEIVEEATQNADSTTAAAALVPPPPLPQEQPPSSSSRQPPAKDHPYYETLKSRTGGTSMNKAKKLEVLIRIVSDQVAMGFLGFDENSRELVNQMKSMTTNKTGVEDIARALCRVIEKLESKSDSEMEKAPNGVVLFKEFVDEDVKPAHTTFTEKQRQKARSSGKKIGAQSQGMPLVQEAQEYKFENMMEGGTEVAMGRLSTRLCPGCNHSFLVVHGKSLEDINRENATKRVAFEAEMEDYKKKTNSASKRQKGMIPKPKNPKYETVRYACLCCMQNCLSRQDGTGCLQCKQATEITRKCNNDQESINPNIDTKTCLCTCDICHCTCSLFFKGDEFTKIAEQTQLAREQEKESAANEKKKTMSLSNLKDRCAKTYAAHHHNLDIDFSNLSTEEAEQNAYSMTAVDVFHSSSLNDIRNRNEFQKETTLTSEYNGMNIAAHRANKQKNKKRKKDNDIYNSNAHRPLEYRVQHPDSPTPTGTLNYDMARTGGRWGRNGLEPHQVPTPMTGESRSVSIENDAGFALLKEMEDDHLFHALATISPTSIRKISQGVGRIGKGTLLETDQTVLKCAKSYAKNGNSAKDLLEIVDGFYKSDPNL